MLRNLAKSKCLRAHYSHHKSVTSHGTLHLQYRQLFSGQTQKSYLSILSLTSTNLYKYSNISRRFASTETVIAEKHSKFRGKIVVASSLVIGAATGFAILYYKRTVTEAKEHEIKEFSGNLERGGPKNLPIATHLIDERDFDTSKPRLVILGSGWGAISVIKELEKDNYHVTVISPQNYFLFTPLLPSATVGTLEARSLLEPIRSIIKGISAHFLEAEATDICFNEKLIELNPVDGSSEPFYIPYDKLVIAVGSLSITFGIEGIEHCHFLKTINDARKLRKKIMDNFEKASLPTTSPKERKRLLSFVVCGGGKL